MKYNINVSVHVNEEEYDVILQDKTLKVALGFRFDLWLRMNYGGLEWQIDDGEDVIGTDYVQYVCYPDKKDSKNYVLAVYQQIDERK